jgi:hypothetical protein
MSLTSKLVQPLKTLLEIALKNTRQQELILPHKKQTQLF